MILAFLNPQGNFDPHDRYWTEHPDFGGQLVYVKELAVAMATLGHRVDILTRLIRDPEWPEFAGPEDGYPGVEGVRIIRLECGPDRFLPKEELWPYLGTSWVPSILKYYRSQGYTPEAFTAHYADGGLAAALVSQEIHRPFTFTGHSLGAQKMDKLGAHPQNLEELDARFRFSRRIVAERVSMSHAGQVVTSTRQEQMEQYAHPAYRGAVDPRDEGKFAVIPPGVNRQVFSPKAITGDDLIRGRLESALARDIDRARRSLPLVVCSSRLDAKKNHAGLAAAFAASPALQSTANLAIIARGLEDPLRDHADLPPAERAILDELTGIMDASGLWGMVTSLSVDSQAELASLYRVLVGRRSVFALTALYEPFGLAPLEAMSCGLPAVVTRNGGPSESLAEGGQEFGVLVDPADPDDIATGLLRVLESEQSWDGYHQRGMRRVLESYTWEQTAQGYLREIQELIQRPPASGSVPIPAYFTDPNPENDIALADLSGLYFA